LKLKAILLIFCVVIIVYSNSLGGEFIFDDDYFILRNVNIRNLENMPSFFSNRSATAFTGLSEDVYRPLTTVTFALNYFFGKVNPFGYHLVNVLFHAFNAILLFLFLYMLFGNIPLALFASLFFACQPVQTEVVSWISGRSSVLFFFFYLLALIFYVRFRQGARKKDFIYSILFCAFSLFSKEMAVTLPFVLIACDMHFFRDGTLRNRISRYAPYFALLIFFLVSRSVTLERVSQCGWWGGSPYYTFLTMARVIIDYIKLLIWPARLCAFYTVDISRSMAELSVAASLGLLILLAASLPFIFKRSRRASFAICFFFISLLPVSNIIPLKALMAERFLYLPSVGFCLLLALCIERLGAIKLKGIVENGRGVAGLLAVAVVIAYSARTVARNEDWRDMMILTRSIIAVSPMNPWAYNALAAAYLSQGKNEEALKPLRKAIEFSTDYSSPRSAMGFAYRELGRLDESLKALKEAVAMNPDSLEAINSLGVTYAQMKRYDEAAKEFESAIKLSPYYIDAYLNLGATYERLQQWDKAIEVYGMIAKRTNSIQDIAISYVRIGDAYFRTKRQEKAKEYYNKALALCGNGLEALKKVVQGRLAGKPPPEK